MGILRELLRGILPTNRSMVQEEYHRDGDHYLPPPPPIPKLLDMEMVSEVILDDRQKNTTYHRPSPTSSLILENHMMFCGSTVDSSSKVVKEEFVDPRKRDERPLKHYLMKRFPWILDVTAVEVHWPHGQRIDPGSVLLGPLNIHITVSAQHHTELMNSWIEKKVKEHLCKDISSILSCMYGNNHGKPPRIIFSPVPSETILEFCK